MPELNPTPVVIDNKAVITEEVTNEYSLEDLDAKLENLESEKTRIQAIVISAETHLSSVDADIAKWTAIKADAEHGGLKPSNPVESIEPDAKIQ